MEFTVIVRFLKHLASASNMSWILNFRTIQNQTENPTMGPMVLGMWMIVRQFWECEADSYRWSDFLELLINFINIDGALRFLGGSSNISNILEPYLYDFHFIW